jgi:hypothetical protein
MSNTAIISGRLPAHALYCLINKSAGVIRLIRSWKSFNESKRNLDHSRALHHGGGKLLLLLFGTG